MRDTLDLKLIVDQTTKQSGKLRISLIIWTIFMLVVCIIAPVIISFVIKYPHISYIDANGWQQAPYVSFFPADIVISPSGVVWTASSNGRLFRLSGNAWESVPSPNVIYRLALAGERVWTASPTTVQYLSGDEWTTYDNVGSGNSPVSMVVRGETVYVLDEQGNLWNFDGNEWHIANVRDFLPSLSDDENDPYARLEYTIDGSLWLQWHQLWRFYNGRWRSVEIGSTSTENVAIAGASQNILWTNWGTSGLLRQDIVSGEFIVYTQRDMGIPSSTRFYEVTTNNKVTWVATTNGLLRFDESASTWDWHQIPNQPLVYATALGDDGTAWIVSRDSNSSPITAVVILIGLLVTIVVFLILLIISFVRSRSTPKNFDKQVREALHEALPELMPVKQGSIRQRLEYITLVLIGLAAIGLGSKWSVKQQFILLPLIIDFLILVWIVLSWRRQSRTTPNLAETVRYSLPGLMWLVWILIVQLLLLPIVDLRLIPDEFANILMIFALSILFGFVLPIWVNYRVVYSLYMTPINNGDYETALRHMRKLIAWQPKRASFRQGEVLILALSNELDEAERKAQESLNAFPSDLNNIHSTLGIIAGIWTDQGRFDEAMRLAQIALLLQVNRYLPKGNAGAWSTLAENYMKRGDDPTRALEITEYAQKCHRESSTLLGIQAWALATLGLHVRAEIALEKAYKKINKKSKPFIADWNVYAGHVHKLQGKYDEAHQHYMKALELDPQGNIGYIAQRALDQMEQTL